MPWRVLAFALGVFVLQQHAVLPAPTFLIAAAVVGAVLWLAAWQRWRLLSVVGAALLGLAWAGGFAHWRMVDTLPAVWEGRDVAVTGVVTRMPQRFERGVRFTFEIEQTVAPLPQRIVLSWYRQVDSAAEDEAGEEVAAPGALPVPRVGERWRFMVRLKRPHGNVNPHGFDYEGWLFERGIRATGYVRKSAENARLDTQVGGWFSTIERLREATRARIARALPDHEYAGVLMALAVGDQNAISPALWRHFAATGITHLMSISGLHVTMIGALVAWLVATLWRRSARLPLVWPTQKAAALAGLSGALMYALLAGFGVPAQRTLYMLGVVAVAMLSGRSIAAPRVLGAALLLVLLIDPWAVLAAGFWLSFGAVALLFYMASGRLARPHWLVEWGQAQWAITLGMIPALLALFQQFSLVSPFANALAIPVVSLLVTPLALLGSVPGLGLVLQPAHALLALLMDFLYWLAALGGSVWQQHAPPVWAIPLALLGAAWFLLPRGFPARWLGLVAFLPLFFIFPQRPTPGALTLTVLDVGQGQALHVQTATHDLIFDTGPGFTADADSGNRILVPYLRATGVQQLDMLMVSHSDMDHAGGAASLMAAVPIGGFVSSLPELHPLWQKSALDGWRNERRCLDGDAWEWDGVRFRVLHPTSADYAGKRTTNAMSCVLRIDSAHGSVLVPGDLEGTAEAELLARHGDDLRADVLVAPHHGGKRTSSADFVAAVSPRAVVFPVGYRNRFGHPWPVVVERYESTGAHIHRTDRNGAVRVVLDATGQHYVHQREARARYWHNTPVDLIESAP
ncbi:MAG: DNA internalization-related competence protein ComEC/Rec2 [Gammaproteobacteria bacterium]|nr:DNA internalization-related competence protein ComEC/Rec2 [Rhodocyclaceae bacterium]MBU3907952.1 DNA internalization-related competence protein ComEC/Rec2 [Gammaproteobacteria bacterium]MBU3989794.1 DNA internalization-related competence protein ComEC/Rec2 [Gammaproteobacteria bacterium]MBU4003858.1 DNA internalization-related competence protein ComEC/Rec2 [Gammaproteobacteria bacterium]MBU4021736.1 DNA internalization-related competence protein ComEC/Rec2 [Gammaproteobacteria bacterium]